MNEVADGAGLGADDTPRQAEWREQRIEFLSAEIGVRLPQPSQLSDNLWGPDAFSLRLRRPGFLIERLGLLAAIFPSFLPAVERRPFHLKGLKGCLETVLGEEDEDFCLLQGLFLDHIRIAYGIAIQSSNTLESCVF